MLEGEDYSLLLHNAVLIGNVLPTLTLWRRNFLLNFSTSCI
jgi:hypothetical protein